MKFSEEKEEHPLITDLDYRDNKQKKTQKAQMWFERDVFQNLIDEVDEDGDIERTITEYKKKGVKIIGEDEDEEVKNSKQGLKRKLDNGNQENGLENFSDESEDDLDGSDNDSDYDMEAAHKSVKLNNSKKDGFEIVSTGGMIFVFKFTIQS